MGVVRQIWKRVADISRVFVTGSLYPNTPIRSIVVHWQPPPMDWVKLNSDESFLLSQNSASYGGIIRDHLGRLIGA